MKTLFDATTRDELIARMQGLDENSKNSWGKMNAYQMVTHCIGWEEMVLRNEKMKRPFIGRLIGPMVLKSVLKDDSPMRRNSPTVPELIIQQTRGDMLQQKTRWISLMNEYAHYSFSDYSFIHPFFGKMTKEQIGYLAYKHDDHHLRQFGC